MTDTFERLLQLIQTQHHLDTSKVTLDSPLAETGLDSLAVAELLFSVEEVFKINLGDVASETVPGTVGEIVRMIDAKRQA